MRSKFLFSVIIVLMTVFLAFAANEDKYYQGTVTKVESFTQVSYKWVVTIGADSSQQLHSPAMKIADCNETDGLVVAIVSAASDVNVIWHYSADGYTWFTAITPVDLDATSNTAKQDTLGCINLANSIPFHLAQWLIVEIDGGSSACNENEIVTITFGFTKDLEFIGSDGGYVEVGEIKTRKPSFFTNP